MKPESPAMDALLAAAKAFEAHCSATAALNAARPPVIATPAERELYQERYQAHHATEREHWTTAIALAHQAGNILAAYEAAKPVAVGGEIEHDPDDPSREYIPLPGGWEVQTKGAGSSYRLLDKKTGERFSILSDGAWKPLQAFFTRFAHEVFAASRLASLEAARSAEALSQARMLLLAVEAGDPTRELALRVKDLIAALEPGP